MEGEHSSLVRVVVDGAAGGAGAVDDDIVAGVVG